MVQLSPLLQIRHGSGLRGEMIDSISAEAEAGYDPTTFRPQRVGRPAPGKGTSPRVIFALRKAS